MIRFYVFSLLIVLASVAPAGAQAPHGSPPPAPHKTPVQTFANPANHHNNPGTMSGSGCTTGAMANRAQRTINPTTGKPYPATIVAIPLTKGGGSVANATTHAQQAQACAHTR